MAFKASEIAEIVVNGMVYRDWETVAVKLQVTGPAYDSFVFTCSEGAPLAKNWAAIRIRPGDHCIIKLAGETAINGYVEMRQVAYTAEQHAIEISGHSFTKALQDGSVMHKTGEFKDKSFSEITKEVIKPFGLQFKELDKISAKKFIRLHVMPGESAFEVVERIARSRGVILGTDKETGDLTGQTKYRPGSDALIEGVNILEGREVMSIPQGDGPYFGASQHPATDETHGPKVSHMPWGEHKEGNLPVMGGGQGVYAPGVVAIEHPGDADDAKARAQNEQQRRGHEQLSLQIVVYGWLKPSGGLWKPGVQVHVTSPMLIVDEDIDLISVTFTQDSRTGTRSTLECKREGLSGQPNFGDSANPASDTHAANPEQPAAPASISFPSGTPL